MLAFVAFVAASPSLLCLGSSAFLAYRDKKQWVWFAVLGVLAGFGGLWMLQTIGAWRLAVHT